MKSLIISHLIDLVIALLAGVVGWVLAAFVTYDLNNDTYIVEYSMYAAIGMFVVILSVFIINTRKMFKEIGYD